MSELKRRTVSEMQAMRRVRAVMVREGAKVRAARTRRKWFQRELGRRCGLSQQTVSQIERGDGATLSLVAWQRVADALELSLELKLGRDAREETADAGHLGIQELVLGLGRAIGLVRRFELGNRPSDPTRWTDVGLIDQANRRLLLIECVNAIGDIGASVRSSDRKAAEAEALAISFGDGKPYSVHVCWVIRATRRNRELLNRYPHVFASRFPGSSHAWAAALVTGSAPPDQRGLVWSDVAATRLFEWRRAKGSR